MNEKLSEISETMSPKRAAAFYDRLGPRYDWFGFYEGKAKHLSLQELKLSPGTRVLNAGCGTGNEHLKIVDSIQPGGFAVALDISLNMVRLTRQKSSSPCLQADIGQLPFSERSFDRIISSYVLDLVPADRIWFIFSEYFRTLRPGGLLVTISMTEGSDWLSRLLMGSWKKLYRINPAACGGCRPVALRRAAEEAGFSRVIRQTVEQFGIPSEIVTAVR